MILSCTACHRQIDAGALAPGAKARCFCGALITVPRAISPSPKMMNCRNCGAALAEREARCGFCKSEVALSDRGLGAACPACFQRLAKDARFCTACGVAIAPQAILKALQSLQCPRCKGALAECVAGELAFVECTSCAGIWLAEDVFAKLVRERRVAPESRTFPGGRPAPAAAPPQDAVRYLPCPVCRDLMQRTNFGGSGVLIDWCGGHGYWFDASELSRILDKAKSGQLPSPARDAAPASARRADGFSPLSTAGRSDPTSLRGVLDFLVDFLAP